MRSPNISVALKENLDASKSHQPKAGHLLIKKYDPSQQLSLLHRQEPFSLNCLDDLHN